MLLSTLKKRNIVYDPHRPPEEFHAQLPAEVRWKADNLLIMAVRAAWMML
jgi:hypothetical protein